MSEDYFGELLVETYVERPVGYVFSFFHYHGLKVDDVLFAWSKDRERPYGKVVITQTNYGGSGSYLGRITEIIKNEN